MTNKKKRTFLRVLSTTAALTTFLTTVASAHGEDVKRDYHPLTVNENGAEKIDKADLVTKEAEFNYNKAKEIFKVTFDKEKKKQEDTSKLRRKDKTGRYTQDEVRKWALSMHHKAVDVDGAFGAQCVDLIMDMYNKFGAYRVGGNAIDYASNHLPKNWTRYKKGETSVKPGDILVWHWGSGDIYGHVDVAISVKDGKIQTIGQNVGTDGSGGPGVITSRTDANLVAIIRPPYVEYDDELKDYADDWQKEDLQGSTGTYVPAATTNRQTYIAPTYDNPVTKSSSNNQTAEVKQSVEKYKQEQALLKESKKQENSNNNTQNVKDFNNFNSTDKNVNNHSQSSTFSTEQFTKEKEFTIVEPKRQEPVVNNKPDSAQVVQTPPTPQNNNKVETQPVKKA